MKKSFLTVFLISTLQFFQINSESTAPYCYLLRIQFPDYIRKIPKINGYYKGKKLIFEEDFCMIPEIKKQKLFFIFITSAENSPVIKHYGKINYLQRMSKKPAKLFSISIDKNNIEEEKEKNIPSKIPDNAVILLINPDFIETVSQELELESFTENNCCMHIIHLPRIKLKQNINKKTLIDYFETANLFTFDLDKHHDINIENAKKLDSATISLHTC